MRSDGGQDRLGWREGGITVPCLLVVTGCAVDSSALDLSFEALGPLVTGHKACGSGFVARFTTAKFLRDKVFQDDDICVALDGIIFNLEQLKSRYACPDYFQTVKAMYRDLGDTFFREFRGEFAGILCDKSTNAWLCFTNPTSSKPLYYLLRRQTVHLLIADGCDCSGPAAPD